MAQFTIQLRTLLKTDFVPALNDYPIFDENYRGVLNQKILDHFLFEEIGQETPDMFNHYLKTRMNEIMTFFNEMYRVQALIANPFHNFEQTETSNRLLDNTNEQQTVGENVEDTDTTSGTTIVKGKVSSHSAQSDTPQSNLTPYNVASGGYASLVNMSETEAQPDSTTGTTGTESRIDTKTALTGSAKTTEDYVKLIKGMSGTNKPELLKQYKAAFVNIDLEIINSLKDLFMIIY